MGQILLPFLYTHEICCCGLRTLWREFGGKNKRKFQYTNKISWEKLLEHFIFTCV